MKEILGKELAKKVSQNQIIGVGTGSTVDIVILGIAERVKKENIKISVVTSSLESSWRCSELGFNVLEPGNVTRVDWGFDGADEVDPKLRLIKGKGGALLREKILARLCNEFVVVVDESKIVKELGSKFPVPVEIIPSAINSVKLDLEKLGATEIVIRQGVSKHGPVITENGNILLDVRFQKIGDNLEKEIKSIVGVVESGIFTDYASKVLVAGKDGVREIGK